MRAIIYAKDADDEQGENERLFHHVLSCGLALDESPLIFRKAAEEVKSDSKKNLYSRHWTGLVQAIIFLLLYFTGLKKNYCCNLKRSCGI